jgi:FkbM family methyltransferase
MFLSELHMAVNPLSSPSVRDDVNSAYRLLLGREPDREGFALYTRMIESGALSTERLVDIFVSSQEFAARRGRSAGLVELQLDGYSMFARTDDCDIGASLLKTKTYEPHVTKMVRELLRVGDTFVDVGANIGYFMALTAHLVGPAGKIVAIEPMDKNVQLLYATIWRNRFKHVEVFPYAASDTNDLLPMATGSGTSNGQVVLGGADARLPTLFAQSRRLDDLLALLHAVHLVKIDIEGHELIALRGFASGLARHRPFLLTEFHPKCMRENSKVEPVEYLAFLFAYGEEICVLHNDDGQVACRDADAVMREW